MIYDIIAVSQKKMSSLFQITGSRRRMIIPDWKQVRAQFVDGWDHGGSIATSLLRGIASDPSQVRVRFLLSYSETLIAPET